MLLKLESILFIIAALSTMHYEFENGAVVEVLEKLVIPVTNPLVYYLIVEVSYADPLLITKLIVLGVEFKVPGEVSFASDGTAKPTGKIKPNQCVPKQSKN